MSASIVILYIVSKITKKNGCNKNKISENGILIVGPSFAGKTDLKIRTLKFVFNRYFLTRSA